MFNLWPLGHDEENYKEKHMESVHEGKKYPCDTCKYQASDKDSLKNHKKSIHEGRKYACGLCDFKAT